MIYCYFMTQRPPMPGAMPKEGLYEIEDYDAKKFVPEVGCTAYAKLYYGRELSKEEVKQYELEPLFYNVPLTRTEIHRFMELLRAKMIDDSTIADALKKTYWKLEDALK